MTSFAEHVDDYLRLRRSFGFKLQDHERLLRPFGAHLDDLRAEAVTIELALAWATERDVPVGSVVPAMRLLVIRGFARYMVGLDARTEIPPTDLIPLRRHRRPPFIYSDVEITALMDEARRGWLHTASFEGRDRHSVQSPPVIAVSPRVRGCWDRW
jgi:integrase/recombinase XerD